ncbi:MAG: DNA mismatch repair protein MutS [Clostridiales Family XIII bacterium]|jgi:DNA mismatch repair protein MutS|nr:DNA mismatch repair protein MutS [Clostridiales Family XIII bacterium]
MTPIMQQYNEIKDRHKDCILFFRLGDFYEMFFDDAHTASRELEITLTQKSNGNDEKAPMCGVPYHAADGYIARLVEKGYRVAICEQMEDPALTKGIVRREVVQIVTPGTLISQTMLREQENNYLVSVFLEEKKAGLAFCDISTGELYGCETGGAGMEETLLNELVRIKAREVLVNPRVEETGFSDEIRKNSLPCVVPLPAERYHADRAERAVSAHFGATSLKGMGLEEKPALLLALGGLIYYLNETQKRALEHIGRLRIYETGSRMALDKATIRNLELTETLYDQQVKGSLLGVLDRTNTAMGSRKMKQWLREPLNNAPDINRRLDAVACLTDRILLRNNLRELLKGMYDLERLAGRIACGNANGKDLVALRSSMALLPELKAELLSCDAALLRELGGETADLSEAEQLIAAAIREDPPFMLREGGLIREGYSAELDALKHSIVDGQQWIASLEGKERERTGIRNLKVGFNKVFGYYIEVTKSYYDLIPEEYIRKQTLANCERFVTPALKEVESVVLSAETKINQMEYELFTDVRGKLLAFIRDIQTSSAAVAALDALLSFAETAARLSYVRPEVDEGDVILIEKGRHPVIEQSIRGGVFVPNDLWMDCFERSMLLITGPNMAGKSTYMRQTALIVLMAQVGSFVPAERASIGVVDRIYTRIGASDNLTQGQSTFYVEMSELAYILNTATDRSLVVLDEIGRGTSTYDGLSIAWAVAEHLCAGERRVRTLFATHYHELTALEGHVRGLKNLNVDVSEEGGDVVFLHKIVEGSASRSYGIHVAKLAGVPKSLLDTAETRLRGLEQGQAVLEAKSTPSPSSAGENPPRAEQMSFFSFAPNPVVEKLKALDLMEITPSKAFSVLEELKAAAEAE